MDKDDHLLRRRDAMKDSALQIASYATKPDRKVGVPLPAVVTNRLWLDALQDGEKASHCSTQAYM
jgi:hypothetical protein